MDSMKPLALTLLLLVPFGAPFAAPFAARAQTAPEPMPAKPVKPSHSLAVTFQGRTSTFAVDDLLKLPQVTLTVRNGHTGKDETYTGPLLADVLRQSGLTPSPETQALLLHSTVIATGADGYFVLYSGAEIEPMFATSKVIVALNRFDLPNTQGGILELVNTADNRPARWVHGLASLSVMSIAPTH
jgi:hypothetical protein